MSVSKNKTGKKINQKSQIIQNMDINQEPEIQLTQLNQKRKRNRFKNIDWDQVLDFDTLVENKQVYEVPWMQTNINKRKKIFTLSDKSSSELNLQSSMSDINESLKNESSSSIKVSSSNKRFQKKAGSNNYTKPKEEKQQKKSSINADSSKINNKQLNIDEQHNLNIINNLVMEEEISNILNENKTIQGCSYQSAHQLKPKTLINENILQDFKQIQSTRQSSRIMKSSNAQFLQSLNNSPCDEEKSLNSSQNSVRGSGQKQNKSNGVNSDNESRFESPLKKQNRSKFMKNVSYQNGQEFASNTFEENIIDSSNEKSIANLNTQTSMKYSPVQFHLNEEVMIINQSYDDSDASTRDEDHHDNQIKHMSDIKTVNIENKYSTRRGEKIKATQKKIDEEKKQIENNEEEENQQIIMQIKEQNTSLPKIKILNNKSISVDVDEENKTNNKKSNKNNKKNKVVNEKNINPILNSDIEIQIKQIIKNNQNDINLISDQNISNQTEDKIKYQKNDDITSCSSQQYLKLDDKSLQGSPQHQVEEIETQQYQKSVFWKDRPHHPNDRLSKIKALLTQSDQLPSEQSIIVDEEMNVEDSGFENSNNNNSILQQEQQPQEADQDQQQVPHLYIRKQDFVTKVGIKNQAVIPEIGSYNQQDKHLERLITKQKVWGCDWFEGKDKIIEKCTKTLKQWYGNRRNQEQCLQHLMILGFDASHYNQFLEENQDYFYSIYNQMDSKYQKKKIKKRSLFFSK